MTAVVNIVQHTPVWVFPLIALALWLGSLNLRERTLHVRSLFAFPLLMLVLSVAHSIGNQCTAGTCAC
jgi:hypothetical protein